MRPSPARSPSISRAEAPHAPPPRAAERRALRRLTNGLLAGVIIILLGVLMAVFLTGKGGKFIGAAATLVGLSVALVAVLAPLRALGTAVKEPAPRALDGAAATTGRLLHETTIEPAPSVTERTTELLDVEGKDRESRRDG